MRWVVLLPMPVVWCCARVPRRFFGAARGKSTFVAPEPLVSFASSSKSGMVDVFSGRLLVSKDGRSVDPEEALQNKVVGLYFSAAWCSPCRDFTPVLCDFYTELLEESQPPAPFEIVFISSDHSAEEMLGYMHSMHGDWLALPFHDPYKHDLKKKYNITAIPKLVIVKQTGEVITDKGRKQIRDKGLSCFRNWLESADIFQNFSS